MMLYISVKFPENILEGFLLIQLNYHRLITKENYSKNIKTRVTVLVVCTLSPDVLYFYKVS